MVPSFLRASAALALLVLMALPAPVLAETEQTQEPEVEPPPYATKEKRLKGPDLTKKREGVFVTGLPIFTSDPLNGFGLGATGYIHFNGTRADPYFAYTPYKARLGLTLQYSTGDSAAVSMKLDMPYVARSPWRLRVDAKFESSPNNLYFGLTSATLNPLPGGSYAAYSRSLEKIHPGGPGEAPLVADVLRNRFYEREWMLNLKGERVLFGNWRLLLGYEIQHLRYKTYEDTLVDGLDPITGEARHVPNGLSLLRQDAEAGKIVGIEGGRVSLIQTSLMYDSRDFEPDPAGGLFLEAGNEFSAPFIGSEFFFNKLFFQLRTFHQLLPRVFTRTVLATRIGYGTILGSNAPFFEFQDQWSADGSIKALGGSQTLRGFKANRFLGRTVAFANIELRHRFADFDLLGQNFTLTAAPFVDLGTVGDKPFALVPALRIAGGAGLRIGWNRSTLIVLDFAASREDRQFFVSFNNSY